MSRHVFVEATAPARRNSHATAALLSKTDWNDWLRQVSMAGLVFKHWHELLEHSTIKPQAQTPNCESLICLIYTFVTKVGDTKSMCSEQQISDP